MYIFRYPLVGKFQDSRAIRSQTSLIFNLVLQRISRLFVVNFGDIFVAECTNVSCLVSHLSNSQSKKKTISWPDVKCGWDWGLWNGDGDGDGDEDGYGNGDADEDEDDDDDDDSTLHFTPGSLHSPSLFLAPV